jgi:MFS family permease
MILVMGRVSDLYGRKRIFIAGLHLHIWVAAVLLGDVGE